MPHSHYLIVPVSGQGVIVDPGSKPDFQRAMTPPFGYTDVYLYAHGWWTTAQSAMIDYNRFLLGFARVVMGAEAAAGVGGGVTLGVGIHWPSVVSEDGRSPADLLQPFTYFNRSKMADCVGSHAVYSIVRIMLEARRAAKLPPPRFHLIGHSFGGKVVCSALEQLAADFAGAGLLDGVEFNAVLLQAAFDNDAMAPGRAYGRLLGSVPRLRLLVTKSALDTAVGDLYVDAQRLMNLFGTPTPGLGAVGPSPSTAEAAGGAVEVAVGPGFPAPPATDLSGRLVVADLTPLHEANPSGAVPFAGHHTDVFHDEVYRLIAAFSG